MPTNDDFLTVERADGKEMAVRRLGHGRQIFCLAGGPGRDAEYLETLADLNDSCELVIPDARGTGNSPPPESDDGYAYDQLAADVESLRTALGQDGLTLLAHSAACTTALHYAAFHPGEIDALLLVTPARTLCPDTDDDTELILRQRRSEPHLAAAIAALDRLKAGPPQEELPGLLDALAPAFYADWSQRQRSHAETENKQVNPSARQHFDKPDIDIAALRTRLSDIQAPVLIITGGMDAATGVLAGDAYAACFPNSQHHTIANSGHYPWVDQPDRFRHAVLGFVSRHSPNPQR